MQMNSWKLVSHQGWITSKKFTLITTMWKIKIAELMATICSIFFFNCLSTLTRTRLPREFKTKPHNKNTSHYKSIISSLSWPLARFLQHLWTKDLLSLKLRGTLITAPWRRSRVSPGALGPYPQRNWVPDLLAICPKCRFHPGQPTEEGNHHGALICPYHGLGVMKVALLNYSEVHRTNK